MNGIIKLEKPPLISEDEKSKLFVRFLQGTADNRIKLSPHDYLYWDHFQYLPPIDGFTIVESWYITKFIRQASSIPTPIKSPDKHIFTWNRPIYTDEYLRKIDMYAGGNFLTENLPDKQASERQKYLARGIVEEAIASSQLEGANTSRRYAKKMLAEHIKPKNKDQHMILNNYLVMQKIEEEYKKQPLSLFMLKDMQAALVRNTLDPVYTPGELRKDDDDIIVYYEGNIAHTPPKAKFVEHELDRLIKYANDDSNFIHPIIKAIQLHFWIGYLHPFPDGNGRLARSLFYWYLLKHDYWAIVYLPISTVIKRSPKKYTYSYIYSEQDNHDFTYFFDYNIKRIIKTIDEFQNYINRKSLENDMISSKIKNMAPNLNNRQRYVLRYLTDSNEATTPKSYATLNGITLRTAYSDLKDLESTGLITLKKVNRKNQYYATDKLKEILK